MKKALSVLLSLVLVLSVCPLALAAEKGKSGDLNAPELTRASINLKWAEVTESTTTFSKAPSIKSPYSAGALTDEFLESGLTYLNFYRYLAHLPDVGMDNELNVNAQHGSVLLAANDQLTHFPSQPADMSDDFYEQGALATSTSNIHYNWGYEPEACLQVAVDGFVEDTGSETNLSCVGHRRWFFNPTLGKVGFGYAVSESGSNYVDAKVFDRSGAGCDYDFVSWPPSGLCPGDFFEPYTPWSVTLNPETYKAPDFNQVTATVTRQSDGKTWVMNASAGQPESGNDDYYFTVNNEGYGVPSCVIFSIGDVGASYDGRYTLTLTGLQYSDGSAASLEYDVDFYADVDPDTCEHQFVQEVTPPTCTEEGYTTYTCDKCGYTYTDDYVPAAHTWGEWVPADDLEERVCLVCGQKEVRDPSFPFLDVFEDQYFYLPVRWAVKNNVTSGTDATHFSPMDRCTRAQVAAFLWRAAGRPSPASVGCSFKDVSKSDYFYDAVRWGVENGIIYGTDDTHFSPNETVTRAQFVTFLYRYAKKPAPEGGSPFIDVADASQYYYDAVRWAYETGVTSGTDATHFSPVAPCIRAQTVSFLYRSLGK